MPLVWALVVLAGFFVTAMIVEDINSSQARQAKLIEATGNFCKQNNLSPEECKAMLQQQNEAVANADSNNTSTGSLIKYALWIGLGFLGVKAISSFKK